jgi:hypothetical protein
MDDRPAGVQAGENGRRGRIHLCHTSDVDVQAQGPHDQRRGTGMFEAAHIGSSQSAGNSNACVVAGSGDPHSGH